MKKTTTKVKRSAFLTAMLFVAAAGLAQFAGCDDSDKNPPPTTGPAPQSIQTPPR